MKTTTTTTRRRKRVTLRNATVLEAERLAGQWLALANEARERGDYELAERHYARSQPWHDRMNELLGYGSGE